MKLPKIILVLFGLGLVAATAFGAEEKFGVYKSSKIIETIEPVFPNKMVQSKRTGQTRIALHIDNQGNLVEYLVLAYSKEAFAEAALEAIKAWRYEPATLDGKPIPSVVELSFDFEATGVVVNLDMQGAVESFYAMAYQRKSYDYTICSLKEVDRIPVPKTMKAPDYPMVLSSESGVLKVTVNFFINEAGEVKLPSITYADDYRLGELAVAAIKEWKFETPLRYGKPVMVKATQVFHFEPTSMLKKKS